MEPQHQVELAVVVMVLQIMLLVHQVLPIQAVAVVGSTPKHTKLLPMQAAQELLLLVTQALSKKPTAEL
jgi:hypothetical protein